MRRIDFLGANNAGKSTLYEEAVRRRTDESKWLTRMEAKRKVITRDLVDEKSPTGLVKAASCHLPQLGEMFVDVFTREPSSKALAEESGREYQQFFEHCAQRAKGREQFEQMNLSWLFNRLEELSLLESLEETVIFDDSLTHSTAELVAQTSSDSTVRDYFERMPVPDKVVHLWAPVEDIIERFEQTVEDHEPNLRGKVIGEEKIRRRACRAMKIADIGACTLDWAGAEVLSLDAREPVEENVRRIEEFVQGG